MDNIFYLDPYCLRVNNTSVDIIEKSVFFFQYLIEKMNEGDLVLIVDGFFKSVITEREVIPFPISLNGLTDRIMMRNIRLINQAFLASVSNKLKYIEFGDCSGDQNYETDLQTTSSNYSYDELFRTILVECYNCSIFTRKILTNEHYNIITSDKIEVKCVCTEKKYQEIFEIVYISKIMKKSDFARDRLKKWLNENISILEPEIKQAPDHHNVIGNNNLHNISDIKRNLRKVLTAIQHFGLFKIHFLEFDRYNGELGSIRKCSILYQNENESIIEGHFISENCISVKVHLYFLYDNAIDIIDYFGEDLTEEKINGFIKSVNVKNN